MNANRLIRMLLNRVLFRAISRGIDAYGRRTGADPTHMKNAKRAAKIARRARRVARF